MRKVLGRRMVAMEFNILCILLIGFSTISVSFGKLTRLFLISIKFREIYVQNEIRQNSCAWGTNEESIDSSQCGKEVHQWFILQSYCLIFF